MAYCKECRKKRQNLHNSLSATKEYNSARGKAFYSENKEDLLAKAKQWRNNVRSLYGISYNTLRKRTDIQHKLRQNIRKRLYGVLILGTRTPDLLGCTVEEFKRHLENQFVDGMSWDNYGKKGWEIDHIKPLAAFDLTDVEQVKDASHFSNLQPLWISDNREKADKYVI